MNVLVISVRADEGGGPRQLRDLLEWSRARDASPVSWFVACPREGVHAGPLHVLATEWIEVPHRRFTLETLREMRVLVERAPIHLIHAFGRGAGVYARALAGLGAPILHTPQGMRPGGAKLLPALFLERALRSRTNLFLFGSSDEAALARAFVGDAPFEIWPPMVHLPAGTSAPIDRVDARRREGGPLRLVTLARLDPHKNVDVLLRGLAYLDSHRIAATLAIFGDGPERSRLERLARSLTLTGVSFEGSTPEPFRALDRADVFVSASRSESFGLAAAQAMGLRLPCILSDVPGHRSLADRGARAWLFEAGAEESFANTVRRVVDASDRRDRIDAAESHVRTSFAPQVVGDQVMRIYARTSVLRPLEIVAPRDDA